MSMSEPQPTSGLTTISRTVASLAVGVVHTVERAVVGEGRMRTARGNAWEAVCADRARADQRAELNRLVAELTAAAPPAAGHSASVSQSADTPPAAASVGGRVLAPVQSVPRLRRPPPGQRRRRTLRAGRRRHGLRA